MEVDGRRRRRGGQLGSRCRGDKSRWWSLFDEEDWEEKRRNIYCQRRIKAVLQAAGGGHGRGWGLLQEEQVEKRQNFSWSTGVSQWWPLLEQGEAGSKENSTVQKCAHFILVPETSEVQWVFPTCWLPFLYMLHELQSQLRKYSLPDLPCWQLWNWWV